MKPIRRVVVGLVVLVGCFLVWCVVEFFRPHVRDYSAETHDEFVAKVGEDFGLPRSARDIRFVASSVSIGGRAHVIKFTAPVEDCRSYAATDFHHYDSQQGDIPALVFVPIAGRPHLPGSLDAYGIRDLRWFDVESVEDGITLNRDHDHRPFTWIDTRRGILYLYWTD